MNNINRLLKKYKPYQLNKNEKTSSDYKYVLRKKQHEFKRQKILERLCNQYDIPKDIKENVEYIITHIKDLKILKRTETIETILCYIICYCTYEKNRQVRLEKWGLWKNENLNWRTYSIILSNLLRYYRQQYPLPYTPPRKEMEIET